MFSHRSDSAQQLPRIGSPVEPSLDRSVCLCESIMLASGALQVSSRGQHGQMTRRVAEGFTLWKVYQVS